MRGRERTVAGSSNGEALASARDGRSDVRAVSAKNDESEANEARATLATRANGLTVETTAATTALVPALSPRCAHSHAILPGIPAAPVQKTYAGATRVVPATQRK